MAYCLIEALVVLAINFIDLLWGIGLGLAVAIIQIMWNSYKVPYHFNLKEYKKGEPILIKLSDDVSFLNKASIERTLNQIPENSEVVIDGSQNHHIHHDILDIFKDFEVVAESKNISLKFKSVYNSESRDPAKDFFDNV